MKEIKSSGATALRDLTRGPVQAHLLKLATPIAAGMVFQTLYYIVDLYFVARIGETAIAGVSEAGNIVYLVMALTQMTAVGTLALLSHAVGARDMARANLVFNQSAAIALGFALFTIAAGYSCMGFYMGAVGAGAQSIRAGIIYLSWYLPGLALQFVITAMGAALRATGVVRPGMIVQAVSLTLNIILAPILIGGWLTGHAFGVAGAGLASTAAVATGALLMAVYFVRYERAVTFSPALWRPDFAIWRKLVLIGFPAGGEIAFIFIYTAIVFALIRPFGDAAQAGFGLGTRLTQAIFMPGLAIAFAAAPIAGQNFGAGQAARVKATLRAALGYCTIVMLSLTLVCQIEPERLVRIFTAEPRVLTQGIVYLRIVSWNFVATGIVLSCSALFTALGNTWPALVSTSSRLLTFMLPAYIVSTLPQFRIEDIWYLSVATVALQAVTSLGLLAREFRLRLPQTEPDALAVLHVTEPS